MSIIASFMVPHPPLIVDEIGKGREAQINETKESYIKIAKDIAKLNPETIIISSPHAPFYSDGFYISDGDLIKGSFSDFGASNVSFEEHIDVELVDEIEKVLKSNGFPYIRRSAKLDHGSMVPLYFIRKYLPNCKIIIVGLSTLSLTTNYRFGIFIKEAINNIDRKVIHIASGDLSHKLKDYGPYGFVEEGPLYDKRIMTTMGKANFGELLEYDLDFLDKCAECGHRSFVIMAGMLDGVSVKSKQYSHQDVTGVGYGICDYYPIGKDNNRCYLNKYFNSKNPYVQLAKKAINEYINNGKILDIKMNDNMFNKKAGVFVSIHEFGMLRGCIGTFLPTKDNIGEEIISNAISASTNDPRFKPITSDELKYLEINVDVLSIPEDIKSKDMLNPKKYGVIVTSGYKRGLLLPDLEGIDDIDIQIDIAKKKAGISDDEEISLQRFEVERYK